MIIPIVLYLPNMLLKKYKIYINSYKYKRIRVKGYICGSCANFQQDDYECQYILTKSGRSLYDECLLASDYFKFGNNTHLYDYIPSDCVNEKI